MKKRTTTKTAFQSVLLEIKKHERAIGFHRDALRKIHDELTDKLESVDNGLGSLSSAVRDLEHAIDHISETM